MLNLNALIELGSLGFWKRLKKFSTVTPYEYVQFKIELLFLQACLAKAQRSSQELEVLLLKR